MADDRKVKNVLQIFKYKLKVNSLTWSTVFVEIFPFHWSIKPLNGLLTIKNIPLQVDLLYLECIWKVFIESAVKERCEHLYQGNWRSTVNRVLRYVPFLLTIHSGSLLLLLRLGGCQIGEVTSLSLDFDAELYGLFLRTTYVNNRTE